MNRWLGIRIDFISNIVVFGTALLVSVLLPVNAGLAGLAITAAINLTDNLSWFVRMVCATTLLCEAVASSWVRLSIFLSLLESSWVYETCWALT